jgi:hypothetical protein
MAEVPLTLADDGPVALTLGALVTLLQTAFTARARLVGAPMTVIMYTLPANQPLPLPTCRLFAPMERLERLAATARANVWSDAPMDEYGFRCDYPPVAATGGVALADMERQARRDSWLIQKTLTDHANVFVTGVDGTKVVAELAKHVQVRNNIGMYAQDAAKIAIILEGEFTVRKSLLPPTGI